MQLFKQTLRLSQPLTMQNPIQHRLMPREDPSVLPTRSMAIILGDNSFVFGDLFLLLHATVFSLHCVLRGCILIQRCWSAHIMLAFPGCVAEYEHSLILERCALAISIFNLQILHETRWSARSALLRFFLDRYDCIVLAPSQRALSRYCLIWYYRSRYLQGA